MNRIISILGRVREPSTWAGVAVLLSIFGVPMVHVEVLGQAVNALAALAAAAAVVLPELRKPEGTSTAASAPAAGPVAGGG